MKNSTAVTQEDYLQFLSGIGQFLNDNASFLSTLNDLLGKYNTPVTDSLWKVHPILAIGGAISGALMSVLAANWAINDFNQRYPYAREDAWREVVGGTPTLLDKLNFSNRREVNGILRNIDPDRYDKTNLNFISSIANDLKMGVGVVVGGILIIGACVLAAPEIVLVTGLGLLITGGISLVEAGFKADYLQKVHGHEQNDWQTVTEQLFGQDYGAFKNWFKGNENPSSKILRLHRMLLSRHLTLRRKIF